MGNLVRYGEYTAEGVAADQAAARAASGEILKLNSGITVLRFLPPKPGRNTPFRSVWQHYIKIQGKDDVFFVCPRQQSRQDKKPGEVCDGCLMVDDLFEEGQEKLAKEFQAKLRVFANVIVRGQEDEGVRVFGFGKQIFDQLIAIRDPKIGGNHTHPTKGFDIAITKKGQGLKTEYEVFTAERGKTVPLCDDTAQMNVWLEGMPDLDRYAIIPSRAEIQEKLGVNSAARRTGPDRGTRQARGRSAQDDVIDVETDDVP